MAVARYRVELEPAASRALRKIEPRSRGRILRSILALETNPRPVGSKKLKGRHPAYRIRIGDYRVIYEIHDDVLTVLVVRIGPRDEIYRI